MKKLLILLCALLLAVPLYAEKEANKNEEATEAVETELPSEENVSQAAPSPATQKNLKNAFIDFINKEAYAANINSADEKKILREKWKEWLGVDIFYPYFKAKEIEDKIKDKVSIKIFKMKGRPTFEKNVIKYTFKVKF